jgi:hypothetical protein
MEFRFERWDCEGRGRMTQDEFWALIDWVRKNAPDEPDGKYETLKTEPGKLSLAELQSFARHFGAYWIRAYTYELWGAAYIIGGWYYASRHHLNKRYISRKRISWLMTVWLTRALLSIFTAFSRVFCYSSPEFYCSKTPLNIIEYFVLTAAGAQRHRPAPPCKPVSRYIPICYALNA